LCSNERQDRILLFHPPEVFVTGINLLIRLYIGGKTCPLLLITPLILFVFISSFYIHLILIQTHTLNHPAPSESDSFTAFLALGAIF
jgi:hypothetical protein